MSGPFWYAAGATVLSNLSTKAALPFTGTLTSFEDWATYAGISAAGSLIIGLVVLLLIPAVGIYGYLLLSGIIGLVVSGALFIVEAGAAGLTTEAEPAMGLRAASMARLQLGNVSVPATALRWARMA